MAQVEHKNPRRAKQPMVVVVLDEHLDRSERFLVQLKHADVDSRRWRRRCAMRRGACLAANKVCRRKRPRRAIPNLTTALDHSIGLLAEAANEPGGLNTRSIARLQKEMNSDGLLFEVRVLRSRIDDHKKDGNNPAKGGTI